LLTVTHCQQSLLSLLLLLLLLLLLPLFVPFQAASFPLLHQQAGFSLLHLLLMLSCFVMCPFLLLLLLLLL
jgi:hypothetical protein